MASSSSVSKATPMPSVSTHKLVSVRELVMIFHLCLAEACAQEALMLIDHRLLICVFCIKTITAAAVAHVVMARKC